MKEKKWFNKKRFGLVLKSLSLKNMNWHLLYTTSLYTQAAIIEGKLEENQIPVKILNRQDRMYISIGEIELYVPIHLKEIAMAVMNETLKN